MPALRIHLLGGKRAQCFGCSLPMADPLPGPWYIRCAMLRAQWGGIRWQKLARASPCLAQVRLIIHEGLGQGQLGIPQPKPMELLEGFMAHHSSFHSASVSRFLTLQCQALDAWNRRSREVVLVQVCTDSGSMAYPFLYPVPASFSRLLRRRFQKSAGRVLLLQWRRGSQPVGDSSSTGHAAAMKWRQIGQPLSVCTWAATRGYEVVLVVGRYSLAQAPRSSAGSRSMLPCRRSVVHAQSLNTSRGVIHRSHGVLRAVGG